MINEVIAKTIGDDVIKRVFAKTGIQSPPMYVGQGSFGIAYSYNGSNQVYKITEDASEAAEAMKIAGFNNKHLADVFGVYELVYDQLKQRMFLIIVEKLKTDISKLSSLDAELSNMYRSYCQENDVEEAPDGVVSYLRLRSKNLNLYKTEAAAFEDYIKSNSEVNWYYQSLVGISDDLKRHHIDSEDYHIRNLGFKANGNLAFFDMGDSGTNLNKPVSSIELEERIFERVMTFMPNSKAIGIKKNCQLNGNGDGTSDDCNQGDIKNIIMKEIRESIGEHIHELNAFHGTPNKFDAFSMDSIGSSDGREVGGWGLYFSNDEDVAGQYSTRSGGVMRVQLPNGNYLNLDHMIDDNLADRILRDQNIPEDQREQFQSDYNDESYRFDINNKQVYDWLSGVLGGNKQASMYLLRAGYIGTEFSDKTNRDATNYVLFDSKSIKNLGYVGDEVDEYLGYVQEMVKFELMSLNEGRWDKLVERKWKEFTQGDESNDFSIKEKEEILRAQKLITVNEKDVEKIAKAIMNEDQQMQPNSGFNLKTMDSMRSFSKRKKYADQTLAKLGSGSSRVVYQMPDGNVLKLAKNEKGLGQNEVECGLGQDHYFEDVLTHVKDCDTNDLWVVSEYAKKITPKRFLELTGVTPEKIGAYIGHVLNKNSSWFQATPEEIKAMGEMPFVNQMADLVSSYRLEIGDIARISSFGEVNRNGQPEVVLVDYGFTTEIKDKYYTPKTRNIWEGYFDEVDIHDMVIDELKNIIGEQGGEPAKTDINTLPFKKDVEAAGGKIYSVGGAVRDGMLGKDSKDLDILITGLQEDKLEEILKRHGRVDNVGKSFGVIKFNHPSTGEIDIALPRTEVPNGQGGYRGFDVKPDHTLPIEKDLERRDFTINAIAKDDSGNLIDPYGGQEDLKNKQIKMVNPNAFGDDPVRMLRAVQFASRFGFSIEPNTMASIQKNASKIKQEPPERYLTEFDKIVKKGNPEIGAKLLRETGLFKEIFGVEPKFNEAELKGVKTMGEFLYQLTKYSIPDPAEFYKTVLKGDITTYNEMKAYDLAYKDKSNNPVQNKLTVFGMYKTYPESVHSEILPDNIKKTIKEMSGLSMPFSFKDLQVNGNDMLALGYTGQQIGKLLKDLLIDIYSGKIRNNRELLMRQITPLDMNPTKIS